MKKILLSLFCLGGLCCGVCKAAEIDPLVEKLVDAQIAITQKLVDSQIESKKSQDAVMAELVKKAAAGCQKKSLLQKLGVVK